MRMMSRVASTVLVCGVLATPGIVAGCVHHHHDDDTVVVVVSWTMTSPLPAIPAARRKTAASSALVSARHAFTPVA